MKCIEQLKQLTESFGWQLSFKVDDGYGYNFESDIIYLGRKLPSEASAFSIKRAMRLVGYEIPSNLEAFAFLHEIGHYQTLPTFTEEELDEDSNKRNRIQRDMMMGGNGNDYYYLQTEIEASRWACEFVENEPEKTAQIIKILHEYRSEIEN